MARLQQIVVIALLLSLSVFTPALKAQDALGIANSNYSPTTSVFINPSSIADSRVFLDIHLLGFGATVQNNFAFMAGNQFKISDLWKNPDAIPEPSYKRYFGPYFANADVNVQGPSASIVVGLNAFALTTKFRSVTSAHRLPDHLANYAIEGFRWPDQMGEEFKTNRLRAGSLSWAEVGLSYARIIKQDNSGILSAGISIKRLIGISGAGLYLEDWQYRVVDTLNLETYSMDGKYAVNEPDFGAGGGWGVDLGITWKRTEGGASGYVPHSTRSGCRSLQYKDKIAVALVDLGRVRFDPVFYAGNLSSADTIVWQNYAAAKPEGLEGVAFMIDSVFGNSANTDQAESQKMRIGLPTAITFQYDRHLKQGIYLGGVWVQGIAPLSKMGPRRMNQLAFIPRFERKRFEVSMPFVLRELKYPSLGLMLRLNSIIIGSDKIGTFLGGQDIYGADIYFHLKYSLFNKSGCQGRGGSGFSKGRKTGGRGSKPCPAW
jgi:hypothetical protein